MIFEIQIFQKSIFYRINLMESENSVLELKIHPQEFHIPVEQLVLIQSQIT